MKKYLILLSFIIIACTEDSGVVNSNNYPESPFFIIEPYPVIQINSSTPVIGTARPDKFSDRIKVKGFHTDSPQDILFVLDYLDTLSSTDLIPGDNIFRFSIPKSVFPISNDITIVVQAFLDQNETWSDSVSNIETVSNTSPVISNLIHSDTLNTNPLSWEWEIEVIDPDPGEEIRVEVLAQFPTGWVNMGVWYDDGSGDDVIAGDKIIQASFDSTARMGLMGDVNYRFIAYDLLDNSDELSSSMYVENNPPVITNYHFPDTLKIKPFDGSETSYLVQVKDGQTLADIDSVVTLFYRPDSSFSIKIDWFNDSGTDGDETAGDGWFTAPIPNPNNPDGEGDWNLIIYSRDKAGNKSNILEHNLHLRNE